MQTDMKLQATHSTIDHREIMEFGLFEWTTRSEVSRREY
jgi:hypothetical protein